MGTLSRGFESLMYIVASTPNTSTLAVRREQASKLVYVNGHVASYPTKRQSQETIL